MPKIYSILHSRCLKKRIKKRKEERKMLKFSLCVYFDFRNSFTSHTKQQHNLESEKRTKIRTRKQKKKNFNTRYAIAWRLHFVNFNSPFYLSLNLYFSVRYMMCVSYVLQGFYGLELKLSHFFGVFLLLTRKCVRIIDPSYVFRGIVIL